MFTAGGTFVVGDLTVGPIGAGDRQGRDVLGSAVVEAELALGRNGTSRVQGVRGLACDAELRCQLDDAAGELDTPAGHDPAYLAIIVSSLITKSGSTISGDTPHLVIVKTNPGYQGNPGHAGTGTITSVIC